MTLPVVQWSDSGGTTAVLAGTLTADDAAVWLQSEAPALWQALRSGAAEARAVDVSGTWRDWRVGDALPGAGGRLVIRLAARP